MHNAQVTKGIMQQRLGARQHPACFQEGPSLSWLHSAVRRMFLSGD